MPQPSISSGIPALARLRNRNSRVALTLIVATIFFAQLAFAQGRPRVTALDSTAGKVDDSVTLMGENLNKELVTGVYFSDDTNDFPAAITDQAADKIVVKVPKIKSGNYNLSIKVGEQILILPLRYMVQ
jgi:hypothetical protein